MAEHTRRRHNRVTWNFERIGSYGAFAAAGSLPVEYLLTSFSSSEIMKLSFARDIKPTTVDFDQLMQRDLDEERAVEKLGSYLNPTPLKQSKRRLDIVFFPPLLIACIPANDGKIVDQYPDEEWDNARPDVLTRTWGGLASLEFFKATQSDPGAITARSTNGDELQAVDPMNVNARFQLSEGNEAGAKLVAIDGQHRLLALQRLAEKNSDAVKNLSVPVCILFATSTSKRVVAAGAAIESAANINVSQVFRKIFVDVNSKMEVVGAHFNILLNDSDVGSLIARRFCDYVIQKAPHGIETLSLVEWNVKSEKDSTILTRDYSLASIGIIYKGLRENFEKRSTLLDRVINIEAADVREELRKAADPEAESPKVAWGKFSVAQRRIIERQILTSVVPLLYAIFLGTAAATRAVAAHVKELARLQNESRDNTLEAEHAAAAYDAIINGKRIPDKATKVKAIVKEVSTRERVARSADNFRVFGYALFQRALFLTLREIMRSQPDLSLTASGDVLIALVGKALEKKVDLFGYDKKYTTNTIWLASDVISVRASTRHQFSRLLLAMLGNESYARIVVKGLKLSGSSDDGGKRLVALGRQKAGEYISAYAKDHESHFARSYATNLALTDEDIATLKEAEDQEEQEDMDIREGKLEERLALRPFREAVRAHLQDEFAAAEEQLKDALGFEVHRVDTDVAEETDSLDE